MKRVDIEVAVAAGLAVVFPLYQLLTLPEICDSPRLTAFEAAALLAALASYLSVPLLSGLLGGRRGARLAWLWTPVVGSVLTAVALYCLVVLKDWGKDWRPAQFATVWLALCLWTLPFAAVAYYSGVRRRHEGPHEV